MPNKHTPLVSVITPVYNGALYIEKTVQSILAQTYQNIELILVNDGSSDNSATLIDQLAEKDDRIKVHHKENGGVAHARNYAIAKAQGEFIALCDQDDLWFETKIEKQIPLFTNDKVGLVYCGAEAVYTQSGITQKPSFDSKLRGQVFDVLAKENMFTCCTAVVRKTHLLQVSGLDDDKALMGVDDWHLWLKLAMICEFDFVAEHLCAHIFHGDNYSMNNKKMHDAELVCLEKIMPIAKEKNINIDWSSVLYSIHVRYAGDYLHTGHYKLSAQAYEDANNLKPSKKLWAKSILLKWVPGIIFRGLQQVKRKINAH
jgi:glycosyltransferase involved in cell wall biosynthesis